MKIQFANGKVYEVKDVDEAIAKCLADGNDPFNPIVIQDSTEKKTTKNADTIEQ
jgi:hypothetical protein